MENKNPPSTSSPTQSIKVGVGGVIFRGDDVLLIKRGKPPFLGEWSIPGGGLDYGEAIEAGILREVMEETQITARLCGFIGVFEALPRADGAHDSHVVMIDHWGEWVSGEPIAGDDAADAAFIPCPEALTRLAWDETRKAVAIAIEARAATG